MKILITGIAGFIGFHTAKYILTHTSFEIIGIDNLNDYYDVQLKLARLRELGLGIEQSKEWRKPVHGDRLTFYRIDLSHSEEVNQIFVQHPVDRVIHLAAQAGVRYSIDHPEAYVQSNLVGFLNILECCRHHQVQHLVYASSSSVYGLNEKMPLSTTDPTNHPVSLYAASKKSNELMAHTYSHLFGLPTTGLRFFTVYGPWGRPDMALFLFTQAILNGQAIQVFNEGQMVRDFTYIDDIVEGVYRVLLQPAESDSRFDAKNPDPSISSAPYKVYNIGNHQPVQLLTFIEIIEEIVGKKAVKEFMPMQAGDVKQTFSDIQPLIDQFGYTPKSKVIDGVRSFVNWYLEYNS